MTRQQPYFGMEPDAKVMAVVNEVVEPSKSRVLDIGSGTGRNALPLARRGHPVDAVELTPKFAEILSESARKESLPITVICQDVFQAKNVLRRDYELMVVSEVVPDFRSTERVSEFLCKRS